MPEVLSEQSKEMPIEYHVMALCFQEDGAVDYFSNHLPLAAMRQSGKGFAQFYKALLGFHARTPSDKVDIPAFRAWLETETDIYQALGGKKGVDDYFDIILSLPQSDPKAVVSVLNRRLKKKQKEELLEKLKEATESKEEVPEAEIADLTRRFNNLFSEEIDPFSSLSTGYTLAGKANTMWDLPIFLETQFPSLNKALGYSETSGFVKGCVFAIIAASGRGKSSLAKSLSLHWVEEGREVLFVNFEEARDLWERVLFTQVTKHNVFKQQDLSEDTKQKLSKMFEEKMIEFGDRLKVEHNPGSLFYEDLDLWIRELYEKGHGPDAIIIDTLQSMFLKSGIKLQRWAQYEQMMVGLEQLAKDLNTVIIVTSQENSDRMKDGREVVRQSDAGGSLTIIQKSSAAIFITPASDAILQEDNIMQLQIPKNRITGTSFLLDPPLVKYNDDEKLYLPYEIKDHVQFNTQDIIMTMNELGDFV